MGNLCGSKEPAPSQEGWWKLVPIARSMRGMTTGIGIGCLVVHARLLR
jgi:hypothetical protein